MNDPDPGRTNIAEGSATVGVQAETVHGDVTVYQIPPGASPEQKFDVGVRCLRGGMARKAREHICEAVMVDGYVTSRSCFYLLIAILSGRTLQQVSDEDLACLALAQGKITGRTEDEWTRAVKVINRLLESSQESDVKAPAVEEELGDLNDDRRDEILRHLDLFLRGSIQDASWARAFDVAKRDRCGKDRLKRVGLFFQPRPAYPRVRLPRMPDVTLGRWFLSASTALLSLTAFGYLWVHAWRASWPVAVLALVLVTAGLYKCARNGAEWRFLSARLQAKERELAAARLRPSSAPSGGFAAKIDRQFTRYFSRYVPGGTDRDTWMAETNGFRQLLRDEVVELYRERRIDADQVTWLVRFLVSDVKTRWQQGRLYEYRKALRVPASIKTRVVASAVASASGVMLLLWSAFNVSPFGAVGLALVAAVAGSVSVRGWTYIVLEYKRHAADEGESRRLLEEREAAYRRWTRKLEDKPDDREMAYWLDCDRKALTEEAMRHYKLQAHNVIAHAFIEAPATSYKRARVPKGPWRYTRYTLLIFLLTADGVRQMTVDLDFQKTTFHNRRRINYRYDAVAAVQVTDADEGRRTFELTLVNGHPIEVEVTGPPPSSASQPGEDPRTVSQVTLDTAGLSNTLHVLEGVAAEGKEWIKHERTRERDRLADLTNAARGFYHSPGTG